jgi:hypothetical protein
MTFVVCKEITLDGGVWHVYVAGYNVCSIYSCKKSVLNNHKLEGTFLFIYFAKTINGDLISK